MSGGDFRTVSLPNNNMTIDIIVTGQTCNMNLAVQLKPGKTHRYDVWRTEVYYCSDVRVVRTSCEIQ